MSLIPFCTIFLGSLHGIAKYKQQPVDYKLLGTYFGIITPYQAINVYSNLDILSKIRLQGVSPYTHIPITVLMLTIFNSSIFGLGHVVGKSAYSILYR
jgi:hypothetical protein